MTTPYRPMPRAERYAHVQQYTGRRRALAAAAHAYLVFFENHEGYAIDWATHTWDSTLRIVEQPRLTLDAQPQCLCEEDFFRDILWAFISNVAPLPPYEHQARQDSLTDTEKRHDETPHAHHLDFAVQYRRAAGHPVECVQPLEEPHHG